MTHPRPVLHDPEMQWLYDMMKAEGVQTWWSWDYKIYFTPRSLSKPLRKAMREHKTELMLTLAPGDRGTRPNTGGLHGWLVGPLAPCYACDETGVLYDPLGWPRHPQCGWLPNTPPGALQRSQSVAGLQHPGQRLVDRVRRAFGPLG